MDDTVEEDSLKESNPSEAKLVKTDDMKPEGYHGTCLRPLGLCDLGGCCDICWYSSTSERASDEADQSEKE